MIEPHMRLRVGGDGHTIFALDPAHPEVVKLVAVALDPDDAARVVTNFNSGRGGFFYMNSLTDLRSGDIMIGPIGGIVPGVFPVGASQILLADRKARLSWRKWWRYRHVAVVVEASAQIGDLPSGETSGPRIVQAMPKGAEEIEIGPEHWTPDYVYIRLPYGGSMAGRVATAARGYVNTPYNFLTYGKLAAGKFGFVFSEALLRKWIGSRRDMMCSQLADQALADAGWHVFDDGRLPQDVVPAELTRALMSTPGTLLIFPDESFPVTVTVKDDGSWGSPTS